MLRMLSAFVGVVVAAASPVGPATAQQADAAQVLVDEAAATVSEFAADEHYDTIADHVRRAKAVIVVPNLIKAGFIVGGEMGEGVALSRASDGGWSAPAFYTLAGGGIGLQAGAESKQIIIAVMTDKGLNELLSNQVEVGANASIAIGEVGGGVGAGSVGSFKADMIAFSRSTGLFGGGSLDGTLIRPDSEKNAGYYGAGTDASDILIARTASNPGARALRSALPGG